MKPTDLSMHASVDTSKPASRGHFKTGQLRWRCKTSVPLPLLVLHVQVDS
jgi:hypothetical protein